MKVVIATHNADKLEEIREGINNLGWEVVSLEEFPKIGEIEENGKTLEENALIKAREVFEKTGFPTISDDTGLEVEALDGAPGVYSARYAGSNKNAEDNMNLLLKNLANHSNRKAQFRTVITYKTNQQLMQFEGLIQGEIISEKKGEFGFGYDPIFVPNGASKTFSQMTMSEKNKYSHRSRAFEKLRSFLESK